MRRRGSEQVVRRIGQILLLSGLLAPAAFADGQLLSDVVYAEVVICSQIFLRLLSHT